MRLRGPTFLPSTADRMRRSAHPCTLHHRKSAHEAAEASETFSDHVRTRPEAPRAKNLRCSSSSARARGGCSSASSCALLLPLLARQVLAPPLWAWRSHEPALARPAGWAGQTRGRGRRSKAALGSADGGRATSGVYYKRVAGAGSHTSNLSTRAKASGGCVLRPGLAAGGRARPARALTAAVHEWQVPLAAFAFVVYYTRCSIRLACRPIFANMFPTFRRRGTATGDPSDR